MKTFFSLLLLLAFSLPAHAQYWEDEPGEFRVDWGGYLWGFKGGLSLGNQNWSGLETEVTLLRHGSLFLESISPGSKFSFYGQLGYHQRGARTGRRIFNIFDGSRVTTPSDKFIFHNVSLGLGAKQVVKYTKLADLYYSLGLRLEYNFDTNLDSFEPFGSNGVNFRADYPIENYEYINRLVYGASFGAGANFPLSDAIGGFVELNFHPDVSLQYNQGAIPNVIDPTRPGGTRTVSDRQIRNFTIELAVGLRFLRKWRYVD